MSQSVRFVPVGAFGAVMGVAGLALVSRQAHQILGVPAWIAEAWAALAVLLLVALIAAYAAKILSHRKAVMAEIDNPGQLAFFGSIPIALSLAGGCLAPYALSLAKPLWWIAVVVMVVMQIFSLSRWLRGGVDPAQVSTGWMIMMIGPMPMAAGGLAIGELESARFLFGIGLIATPFIMGMAFQRTIIGPQLPDGARALSFILLVPAGLTSALVPGLWNVPGHYLLDALYYFDLILCAGLLVASRNCHQWPFTPGWWAMTFPLDALAAAGLIFAKLQPGQPALLLAWVTWGLATVVVLVISIRTIIALSRGKMFVAPKAG
jgi:tellurite resistance protein